jgi:hypothetical protein
MRTIPRDLVSTAALVSFGLLAAGASSADVIFSDLGPGYTFNGTGGLGIDGPGVTYGPNAAAAEFTATVTATVGRLDLGLDNNLGPNLPVTVSLWTVNGGVPGTQLAAWTLQNIPSVPAVNPTNVITTLSNLAGPQLTAGTPYFLSVAPAANTTFMSWNDNITNTVGQVYIQSAGANSLGARVLPAFDVQTVPLPAATWLLLSGLGALAGLGRWQRLRVSL